MIVKLAWLVALTLSLAPVAACSAGGNKTTGAGDVQLASLMTLDGQRSSFVTVTGNVRGTGAAAEIAIEYTRDATGALRYESASTTDGAESRVGYIAVSPWSWQLADGRWTFAAVVSSTPFTARSAWSLVRFSDAARVGTEDVAGVSTDHFRSSVKLGQSVDDFAGRFLASSDVELGGALDTVDVDYWIDRERGWPVRAVFHAGGTPGLDLTVELRSVDDAAIRVSPPPSADAPADGPPTAVATAG